jgi:hypothetical protein
MSSNVVTCRMDVYSPDMRWTGDLTFNSPRRLSDFVNSPDDELLMLTNALPAMLDKNSYLPLAQVDSLGIVKRHVVAIIPRRDAETPPSGQLPDRVARSPFSAVIVAPPFLLRGALYFPTAWKDLSGFHSLRLTFVPMTDVQVWHYRTGKPIETEQGLALIGREHIVSLQPLQPPAAT